MKSIPRTIAEKRLIAAPGIFDMVSTLLADKMGFDALFATGYGVVASGYGLPDAGIATYGDMLDRIARMCTLANTPVIADADTGFGGPLNVRHTVQGYESAGVCAIQLEDQEFPKRCGHTGPRPVISCASMVHKIDVAAHARHDDDFMIIARTDARLSKGLDDALSRARQYHAAGADIVFVEALQNEQEILQASESVGCPLTVNMAAGGLTPALSRDTLGKLGVAIALYPTQPLFAATSALHRAYGALLNSGELEDCGDLYEFSAFNELIGMNEVLEFEKQFPEPPGD